MVAQVPRNLLGPIRKTADFISITFRDPPTCFLPSGVEHILKLAVGATQISTDSQVYAERNAESSVSLGESEAAAIERLEKANANDQASYNRYDGEPASDEARTLAAELGLPLAISAWSKRAHLSASHSPSRAASLQGRLASSEAPRMCWAG